MGIHDADGGIEMKILDALKWFWDILLNKPTRCKNEIEETWIDEVYGWGTEPILEANKYSSLMNSMSTGTDEFQRTLEL
jgi:hypothetical protein